VGACLASLVVWAGWFECASQQAWVRSSCCGAVGPRLRKPAYRPGGTMVQCTQLAEVKRPATCHEECWEQASLVLASVVGWGDSLLLAFRCGCRTFMNPSIPCPAASVRICASRQVQRASARLVLGCAMPASVQHAARARLNSAAAAAAATLHVRTAHSSCSCSMEAVAWAVWWGPLVL
jgi:hypothetical protein